MNCSIPVCATVDIQPFTPIPSPNDGFSARLDDEQECLLTQVLNVGDKLIVVDNENKRLKRFRIRSRTFVDQLLLDDPCGASVLPLSSHVIVTEPEFRILSFISMDGVMTLSSRRKTEKKYQPICCVDEERLVVGCCELGESSVDILNYMGVVLVTVSSCLNNSIVFRTPASLTYLKGDCIMVSDSGLCKVVGIGLTGHLKFVFDPKCIPSGISADKDNNIFLCCYDKKTIQSLKFENNRLYPTCSDFTVKCPLSVTSAKNSLYVTEEMPNDKVSIIKVTDEENRIDDEENPVHLSNIHLTVLKHDDDLTE
ncbi:uncharacterized protein LOC133196596 [Saccostrea echinata]|uniref:uncharacterized protein LOC133196596 n=1 Tax=Saccostrea echinata TaxID=191078 RepID=UPI002A7F85A8|nr:uncharacterized protein LOC133196596 [Saccostrea echinata]